MWDDRSKREFWGPRLWYILHGIAALYEPSERLSYEKFYCSTLINVIPCQSCREHTTSYIKFNAPDLTNSGSLQNWTRRFHNYVNARLNKIQIVSHKNLNNNLQHLKKNYVEFTLLVQSDHNTSKLALNNFIYFMQSKLNKHLERDTQCFFS